MKNFYLAAALAALTAGSAASRAAPAHEHGAARVDVAVEAGQLVITLESPLDGLLGFEHAPRTPAQKQDVEKMLATLRAADRLFRIAPAARCRLAAVALNSAPLQLGNAAPGAGGGHGDLDASFEFSCQAAPAFVELGLFAAFPRLSRIEVQTATANAQHRRLLKRPAQRVDLAR